MVDCLLLLLLVLVWRHYSCLGVCSIPLHLLHLISLATCSASIGKMFQAPAMETFSLHDGSPLFFSFFT